MTILKSPINIAARFVVLCVLMVIAPGAAAAGESRFFYSGDGRLRLFSEKNGQMFEGAYRRSGGGYDASALAAIHRVFGAPYDSDLPTVSLRLIAYLDFLEDRLRPGALITITSGYRSPAYNTGVRARGGLAAKASLHQYGMAADFVMAGVSSERVWQTVKSLGFGGAGYYHGRTVHVDVGPARFWDETTSGVGTGISDDNKLIGIVTDFDVYRPGDPLVLRFIRMTAFPIGVDPVFSLEVRSADGRTGKPVTFRPTIAISDEGDCPQFADIDQMAAIRWRVPSHLPPGRYAVCARFCAPRWAAMPAVVETPVFEVGTP
jgi:uncharacterized protein YcbK (DUF882 family)